LFASTTQLPPELSLQLKDANFFESSNDYCLETFRKYKTERNENFSPSQHGVYKQQLQKIASLNEPRYKCYKEKAQNIRTDTFNIIFKILQEARPDPRRQINDSIGIMPLKDCDIQRLINVINNNIHNATHGKDISKEHYQFLVCGEHFLIQYDPSNNWKLKSWIHQLLSDTGGFPHALEYLLEHFFDEIERHNPNIFFNEVASDLDKHLTWALIHYSIRSIPVMKTDIPSQEYLDESFEVLERDRHLVLNHHGDNKYVDWERFVAEFEAFHNNVLIELNKKVKSLQEIYHSTYGHKNILELHIKLRPLTVRHIWEQFSCLKLSNSIDLSDVDWRSNNIIINGWAAPFADCFRREITDDETFLLIAEHKKNLRVLEKAQEPLRSRNEIMEKIPEMKNHPDAVKMMTFFPYEDDIRDLDSPKKRCIDPECQRMSHVK
ncbi:15232_t:CDS:2, partial [Racocetra fulgida]